MLNLADKDFVRLTTFVEKNFGINLKSKKQLIEGRLSNYILSSGFEDFTDYIDHIISDKNSMDIEQMLNKLTTNHTYFMRENAHFEFFKNTILPYLVSVKKNKTLNIWSAGCSSGEEPYNISMIIDDFFGGNSSWDTRVLATDISQKALGLAKVATYEAEALKDLPEKWKKSYFTQQGDKFALAPKIKNNVMFRTFNLMDPIKFKVKFDVIFCRNVMIYFEKPVKDALIERFYNATANGGYLLIGHSESVSKDNSSYKYVMPATYRKI